MSTPVHEIAKQFGEKVGLNLVAIPNRFSLNSDEQFRVETPQGFAMGVIRIYKADEGWVIGSMNMNDRSPYEDVLSKLNTSRPA